MVLKAKKKNVWLKKIIVGINRGYDVYFFEIKTSNMFLIKILHIIYFTNALRVEKFCRCCNICVTDLCSMVFFALVPFNTAHRRSVRIKHNELLISQDIVHHFFIFYFFPDYCVIHICL